MLHLRKQKSQFKRKRLNILQRDSNYSIKPSFHRGLILWVQKSNILVGTLGGNPENRSEVASLHPVLPDLEQT